MPIEAQALDPLRMLPRPRWQIVGREAQEQQLPDRVLELLSRPGVEWDLLVKLLVCLALVWIYSTVQAVVRVLVVSRQVSLAVLPVVC